MVLKNNNIFLNKYKGERDQYTNLGMMHKSIDLSHRKFIIQPTINGQKKKNSEDLMIETSRNSGNNQ